MEVIGFKNFTLCKKWNWRLSKRMLHGTFLWALYFKQDPDGFLMKEDGFGCLTTLKYI